MHDRCMEVLIKVMVGGGCCKVLKVCLPSLNDLCTIVCSVVADQLVSGGGRGAICLTDGSEKFTRVPA